MLTAADYVLIISLIDSAGCPRQDNSVIVTVRGHSFGPQHASVMIGGELATQVDLASNGFTGETDAQTVALARLPAGSGTTISINIIQKNGEVSEGKKLLGYEPCPAGTFNTLNNSGMYDASVITDFAFNVCC